MKICVNKTGNQSVVYPKWKYKILNSRDFIERLVGRCQRHRMSVDNSQTIIRPQRGRM